MAVKIYDANEVSIEFATRTFDSGYDDGVFCRIKKEAPSFGHKQGTDGQITRYKTNQSMTSVSLILMQSSEGMNILSSLLNIDELGTNGAGVAPILIRDRNGLSVFAAPEAWIVGPPEVAYGREPEAREWIIACANPTRFDGGN
jgi:hypothetical protein